MKHWLKGLVTLLIILTAYNDFVLTAETINVVESNPMRAIWLRPKETTQAEVEAHVEQIKNTGLNTIFLETVFNGYTIFPVEYDATYQNPDYKGFDVLKAYIDACHRRGMQLHCWVESFYIGTETKDAGGPVVAAHEDWLLTDQEGNNWEDTRYGKMFFFNPARPECREWIVGLYEVLCTNYDIDGIQLDYVRYPEKTRQKDYGYDSYTLHTYITEGNPDTTSFVEYKQQMVTEYVKLCSERLKKMKPELIISLSVYPFFDDGKDLFMQSAQEWMDKGYGDLIVPMAYYENLVGMLTTDALFISKSTTNTVIGLCSQNGFTPESLKAQIETVLETGAGVAIFEFESFFDEYDEDWSDTVFYNTVYDVDASVYATKVEAIE